MATCIILRRFSPEASGDPEEFEKLADEQEEEEEEEEKEEDKEQQEEEGQGEPGSPKYFAISNDGASKAKPGQRKVF